MEFKSLEEEGKEEVIEEAVSEEPGDNVFDHDGEVDDDVISKKIAAIEAHKRSRTTMIVCIMGIAATVTTTIFVSIHVWAGAAAACIFSGVFAMLGVRAIKDTKNLESTYNIGKKPRN